MSALKTQFLNFLSIVSDQSLLPYTQQQKCRTEKAHKNIEQN